MKNLLIATLLGSALAFPVFAAQPAVPAAASAEVAAKGVEIDHAIAGNLRRPLQEGTEGGRRLGREVAICEDRDVQELTFDGYMNKRLVRAKPMSHVRVFLKDCAHLLGLKPVMQ